MAAGVLPALLAVVDAAWSAAEAAEADAADAGGPLASPRGGGLGGYLARRDDLEERGGKGQAAPHAGDVCWSLLVAALGTAERVLLSRAARDEAVRRGQAAMAETLLGMM